MNTEKCNHCGNSMKEKRKGTKYCSDSCKQKAYIARKESLIEPEKELPVFYLEDFIKAQGSHWEWYAQGDFDQSDLDIITFCFIMRNASKSFNQEQMVDYVLGFASTKQKRFDSVRKSDAFQRFHEEFLEGKYKVVSRKKEVQVNS